MNEPEYLEGRIDTLWAGQSLNGENALISLNARYHAVMEAAGGLVIYNVLEGHACWSTGTSGSNFVVMQGDGNFVMYRNGGGALWATGTNGTGADHVVMQDDGNLVVYGPTGAKWASNTVGC